MNSFVSDSETLLRFGIFLCVFLAIAVLEACFPRRVLRYSKGQRWRSNFAMAGFNTALTLLLVPLAGVAAAFYAQENDWGIFNKLEFSGVLSIVAFLIAFDITIYFQHRLFHEVPILWRFHRMHHTDLDYDVSTGNRFHPASILFSSIIKIALVFVIGPLPVAVLVAEVLLNATSMFNHSNLKLPSTIDRLLRLIIVTPDMHRLHHSIEADEHCKNFGFNFPWWDKLFDTYKDQPDAGHESMELGVPGFESKESLRFFHLLFQPLRTK